MTNTKPKHITIPKETHDRTAQICEQLGCSFSRLVSIALEERLPHWEYEVGSFQLEKRDPMKELFKRLTS